MAVGGQGVYIHRTNNSEVRNILFPETATSVLKVGFGRRDHGHCHILCPVSGIVQVGHYDWDCEGFRTPNGTRNPEQELPSKKGCLNGGLAPFRPSKPAWPYPEADVSCNDAQPQTAALPMIRITQSFLSEVLFASTHCLVGAFRLPHRIVPAIAATAA
jgi:hypothetical protein